VRVQLDVDFLAYALSTGGPERRRLTELAESDAEIQISAVAWYEFSRGPRTPQQITVVRSFFFEDGSCRSPRSWLPPRPKSSATSVHPVGALPTSPIGVTAASMGALLLSRNAGDFAGIPHLQVEGTTG